MTRAIIIALFGLAGLLFAALSVASRQPGSRIPSLGEVGGFIMAYRVGRIPLGRVAVLGFWWWVGLHFFAR